MESVSASAHKLKENWFSPSQNSAFLATVDSEWNRDKELHSWLACVMESDVLFYLTFLSSVGYAVGSQ